jgi:hypothetical protein
MTGFGRGDRVTKAALLERIREDRAAWEAVVAGVPQERLTTPELPGGWSLKDTMAHITWAEREGIGMMRARRLVGSDLWKLDQDARNEAIYQENRHRELEDVLDDHARTFDSFISAIEELSDEELNDPAAFPPLATTFPGWLPWRILYDPDHYAHHAGNVRAHLNARTRG